MKRVKTILAIAIVFGFFEASGAFASQLARASRISSWSNYFSLALTTVLLVSTTVGADHCRRLSPIVERDAETDQFAVWATRDPDSGLVREIAFKYGESQWSYTADSCKGMMPPFCHPETGKCWQVICRPKSERWLDSHLELLESRD